MVILVPIRLVSEANSHAHWRSRQKRAVAQRFATMVELQRALLPESMSFGRSGPRVHRPAKPRVPCIVTIVRIAPRLLDDDNLAGSGKAVRDEVARWIGVDDKPGSGVLWRYEQRSGKPREYACEIRLENTIEGP